jgi:hypothetical protein
MNRHNRQRAAIFFGLALISGGAAAQTVGARVDGRAAHGYVTTLAVPEWQGRRTLTPGFDRASEWAAARFAEWGLTPAGDGGTFFQAVPILGPKSDFVWATGVPALDVGGRVFSFKEAEFVVDPSSTRATDVTAEAVFAGYGIAAPAKGLDEYAGLDVAGKVVFVLRGSPKDAPPETSDFPPDPPTLAGPPPDWADETADQRKVMTAYRKGAAAIVLCDANPMAQRAAAWPKTKPGPTPFSRPFLVVAASDARVLRGVLMRDSLESLVGFVDRVNRMRRAVQAGTPRSEATGVRVRVKGYDEVALFGESFGRNQSRNVLARIEGSDPVLGKQAVVIGAHLDHLGYRSGLVHPGADDNASGSAVVLEVARTMAAAGIRPRRTVVFALWCGEENGHHGSKRFTAAPPGGLAIERIVAYINMDMVGLGTGVEAAGARDFPSVFDVMMRDQVPDVARAITPESVGPGGSDYASFIEHGVDAISLDSIGGHGHPDYHDAADVASKVQPELLGMVGQFVLQAAVNLAKETKVALPVPGRRETCDALRFVVPDIGRQSPDGWRTHAAQSPRELETAAVEAIDALKQRRVADDAGGDSSAARLPLVLSGVRSSAVDGSVPLLQVAAAALGIGRLDLPADEGPWVHGVLTDAGRRAIVAIGQGSLVLRLVRPSPGLLTDVLLVALRPILVSDMGMVDESAARQVKAKDGVLVVECGADAVEACAANLHGLRTAIGGSGNLLVSMGVEPTVAKPAHRALYKALAARGWTKDEIFAMAGLAPDGGSGGNLARFTPR